MPFARAELSSKVQDLREPAWVFAACEAWKMELPPVMRRTLATAALFFFVSAATYAQQQLPPGTITIPLKAPEGPVKQASNDIVLDVVVSGKNGVPVAGLAAKDFTLLSDKQPQKLLTFDASDGRGSDDPTHVIVLIDDVNSGFQTVAYARDQLTRFLKQAPALPSSAALSIALFTDTGTTLENGSSRDPESLLAFLDKNGPALRVIRRSAGFYGAAERLQLSLVELDSLLGYLRPESGRKLILWISPGWPLLSGPQTIIDNKEEQQIFNEVVHLSTTMRQERVTITSIDPLGTSDSVGFFTMYYKQFLSGVSKPQDVLPGNLALQVLAAQSGGQVLNSNNDITGEMLKGFADAGPHYTLTFAPGSSGAPDTFHPLAVQVDQPGLTARTRAGYYVGPPR